MPPPPGMDQAPDPNAQYSLDGGVPEEFLHPCCQKDLQEKRVRDKVLTKVRAADRAAQALARRKGAVVGVGKDAAGLAEWARHRHEHVSACRLCVYVCMHTCRTRSIDSPWVPDICPPVIYRQGSGCCELMADYPALAFLRMDRTCSFDVACVSRSITHIDNLTFQTYIYHQPQAVSAPPHHPGPRRTTSRR